MNSTHPKRHLTMKELVFATNNRHKLEEIAPLIAQHFKLVTLSDIGCYNDIEENAATLEGNAKLKANFVYSHYCIDCFADDTGLEIEELDGKPGVYSARYAGYPPDFNANVDKVLQQLEGIKNRNAQFRTVIALIINQNEYLFEGKIKGTITEHRRGVAGFGYDPVFIPDGYSRTFAEMHLDEKNIISHRSLAFGKLIEFLRSQK